MSNPTNERNPNRKAEDEAGEPRTSFIQPRRNPETLFRGWGPKLFAAALAASSIGLATGHAQAATTTYGQGACPAPNRAAAAISNPAPEYPEMPKLEQIGGAAVLQIHLSANGTMEGAQIAQSSGNADLDREALRVANNTRFAAEKVNCQAVEGDYLYAVEFRP